LAQSTAVTAPAEPWLVNVLGHWTKRGGRNAGGRPSRKGYRARVDQPSAAIDTHHLRRMAAMRSV
jgi:hypothetical protein